MYKNIQKIYEIIYNIDCLICDNIDIYGTKNSKQNNR